jgi:glycosyltransferase involved in cell wall biosynthesis
MPKLALITDAWSPQINGVVRTLQTTLKHLGDEYEHLVIEPSMFPNMAAPGYDEIRLSLPWGIGRMIREYAPDHIHIATEGPLGWAAMFYCRRHKIEYTTSYHTQFPEYLKIHYGIPLGITYWILQRFHKAATAAMVNTPTMQHRLAAYRFRNLKMWSRGVDLSIFGPEGPKNTEIIYGNGPILMNVGRVSAEKNLEAFYKLDIEGQKVQIGSGPQLEEYKAKYPEVQFLGPKSGEDLAACYRSADVFVFPSKSDTFGLVMLEAMASGVPVAAYPVAGPIDVVENRVSGYLDSSLNVAIFKCLKYPLKKADIIDRAKFFSWERCTEQFRKNLVKSA